MPWEVTRHRGTAEQLHHLEIVPRRSIHLMELTAPALALGSTQSEAVLGDASRTGAFDITRRHSGGGLVVMRPGEIAWVDVVIPDGDPLWRVDVGEAFVWLGRLWAAVLADRPCGGYPLPVVHRGPPRHADLGRAVCFAGVGSGEVSAGERKVVGMSQRRTRQWARFQCLVHQRFAPEDTLGVLAPHLTAGGFGERLGERLADGVGVVDDVDAVVDALVERLHDR